MKSLKFLSATILTGLTLMLGQAVFPDKASASGLAAECPTDSSGDMDFTSYADLAAFEAAGNCRGTPEIYGVTVYKMGFCSTELASGGAGTTPVYTDCEVVYNNDSGEATTFSAGTTFSLASGSSSIPAAGSYNYAFILFSKDFSIKSKLGPFADGDTWYTARDVDTTGSVGNMSQTESDYTTINAPLTSFDGGSTCDSDWSGSVGGSTLKAYLISETDGSIIPSTGAAGGCSGHDKVLGVASTSFTIDSSTTVLTTTFDVSLNGTTFYMSGDGVPSGDSGPFSVTFTVE